MNDKPETKIDYISPLKKICMTIGELPTSYLESMTYYEMLVWFVEYLKNQIIPIINNNSAATEELQNLFIDFQELFTELQSYVDNYFDNLDVQEEIDNKLDEMYKDGTLESLFSKFNRFFKPEIHYSVNWAGISKGIEYTAPISSRENILTEMKNCYFDGFILPIQTKWNQNTGHFEIINDLDLDLEYAIKSAQNSVPLHALKIHHANYSTDRILTNTSLFIDDMKDIIDTLYNKFKDIDTVKYLTVLNELTPLFIDSANDSLIISLINYAQGKGYLSGITSAGSNYFNRISDNILNNCDILATNEYVRIGSKRENTTYQDSLIAWENAPFNNLYEFYAGKYRDKKFIISETGCMNHWEALQAPSSYNFTSPPAPNSSAQNTYYYGMFNKCDLVNEVWLWFEIPENKELFKYYLGRFEVDE